MYRNFSFKLLAVIVWVFGTSVHAQTMFEEGSFKPYEDLTVRDDELSRSIQTRVLFFAHFTCPFCRGAHGYMHEWGDQLPAPYNLEIVPAVALPEHYPMAIAYYAMISIAPQRLREYESALYETLQGRKSAATEAAIYRKVAESIGVDIAKFDAATQSSLVRGYVQRAYLLTKKFGIEEVPTVVVANRYKTGPGRVQNDQASFVAILNGLISMHYREWKAS